MPEGGATAYHPIYSGNFRPYMQARREHIADLAY